MHIKARSTNGARERALSDQELAEVWRACPDNDYGKIVRLLLLSGQRKQEIGGLRWSEIDLGERVIKLPSERVKNWRAHVVWLSDPALAIIKSIPTSETRDLVFGRGANGYSGWTASKAKLDARIAEARAEAGQDDIDPCVSTTCVWKPKRAPTTQRGRPRRLFETNFERFAAALMIAARDAGGRASLDRKVRKHGTVSLIALLTEIRPYMPEKFIPKSDALPVAKLERLSLQISKIWGGPGAVQRARQRRGLAARPRGLLWLDELSD